MTELRRTCPTAPTTTPTTTPTTGPTPGAREPWAARRRREAVDEAALRAHDSLVRRVSSGRIPTGRTAAGSAVLAASVVVLGVTGVAVALLGWATVVPKGAWGWVLVGLGWLVMAQVLPRPHRLEAEPLEVAGHPATHRLVTELAEAAGAPAPRVVAVDADLSAHVVHVGWRSRPALVIGLPLWTMLRPEQRLALLAHELGHLRGRDTAAGAAIAMAHDVLERLATLVVPLPRGAYGDLESLHPTLGWSTATENRLGVLLLRVLSLPFVALLLAFERLAAVDGQRREYLADLAAARVTGPAAVVRLLFTLSGMPGVHTTVAAAVRRGEEPFDALEAVAARPALGPAELAAARHRAAGSGARWDDSHPRDDLRISLLEALPGAPASGPGAAAAERSERVLARLRDLEEAANRELAALRPALSRRVRDELLESWL